jgi:hypothetical protein
VAWTKEAVDMRSLQRFLRRFANKKRKWEWKEKRNKHRKNKETEAEVDNRV